MINSKNKFLSSKDISSLLLFFYYSSVKILINIDNFNIVNFTVLCAAWPLIKLLNLFVNCLCLMLEIIYKKYFELVLQNQNRNRIIKNKSGEIPVLFIIKK